jgi:predicted nuclease with TOPRIM domain
VFTYYNILRRATDLKSLKEIFNKYEEELIAERKRLKDELNIIKDKLKALNEAYDKVRAEIWRREHGSIRG